MSLRIKTLLAVLITVTSLIVLLSLFSRRTLMVGYEQLEQEAVTSNMKRVLNTMDKEMASLASENADWSHWDDTYDFVQGKLDTYIADNITPETLQNLRLNFMVFLDMSGKIVYSTAVDSSGQESALPVDVPTYLQQDSPLLQRTSDLTACPYGLIMLNVAPAMVSSCAILNNQLDPSPVGTLLMARYLDAAEIQSLSERLELSLTVDRLDQPSDDIQAIYKTLSTSNDPFVIQQVDSSLISGYALSSDFNHQPIVIWRVDMPRDITEHGEASFSYFLIALILIGAAFTVVVLALLERMILSRVAFLHSVVTDIRGSADLTKRVNMSGKDEIAGLSQAVNGMLEELLRVQTELKNAIAFKSQILANVSHDARTPLTVITMRAEMIKMGLRGPLTPGQEELVDSLIANAHQLLIFINNLLDASQLDAGKLILRPREFMPNELIENLDTSLKPLAEKKGLTLTSFVANDIPPSLYGDPERLSQIVFNLVGNAIKFTTEGHVILCLTRLDSDHWTMQVSDTGPGIPPEAQPRLFEAFYQVDGSGTRKQSQGVGLGLSIVQQLTTLMGGCVSVESKMGSGSVFTVTLPLTHN